MTWEYPTPGENVARDRVWGAFGTTGQRCTATSRLIVHEDVHDALVERIAEAGRKLKLGYGNDDDTEMGPLINQKALEKVTDYCRIGQEEDGATLHMGGKPAAGEGLDDGFFFEPTIFTGVTREMRIAQEEIFGPVLSVIRVDDFDEFLELKRTWSSFKREHGLR